MSLLLLQTTIMNNINYIKDQLKNRILVLDGAMGSLIQQYNLTENDFRGTQFSNHSCNLIGNNDILCITQPNIIKEIHKQYLDAGADIIETNTFNGTNISQSDYLTQDYVYQINYEGARIAKEAANIFTKANPNKPRFVAGSMGPTNQTTSMSPDVDNPSFRKVTFDTLVNSYSVQAKGLLDGGADILLIETVFDTLNAKAAIFAIKEIEEEKGCQIPIMISGTITDSSGRTLSGQTVEAFYTSLSHANPISIGLNCAFGANQIKPYIKALSDIAEFAVSSHPNAGLPDELGEYTQDAINMGTAIESIIKDGLVNIIGGCCGTTPEHIKVIAQIASKYSPRTIPNGNTSTILSGLEVLKVDKTSNFINIGERTNVSGSAKFARLIREDKFEEAIAIAEEQVEGGAQIIDVCMDDALIDGCQAMKKFLNLIASEPNISKLPIMIDSSDFNIIEAGLKCTQGKSIVNSISLKEGEEVFIKRASTIKKYGAAIVVMLFDEKGQADTFYRKSEIASRAYNILTKKVKFAAHDIIIDPNVLAIATGIKEHNNYAVDFIKTCKWIKENLPHVKISGGISNVSFSFRGNNYVREAMHSVFLFHSINNGLDMGIVNPSMLQIYDNIKPDLLKLTEDVILNRRIDATERLTFFADKLSNQNIKNSQEKEWRKLSLEERINHSLIKGITEFVTDDITEALSKYPNPIDIIEQPLMNGMETVGDLFGAGKMFLPQVVKSARVMRKAVDILQPLIKQNNSVSGKSSKAGKVILATVKGDVHDIGKNIVGIILSCNNYEVIDLGVMTPAEKIIETAISEKADIIGLSGLITPSLHEMVSVAKLLQDNNLSIPLIIGGATTSVMHTAVKIAPHYNAPVVHVKDASRTSGTINNLINNRETFHKQIKQQYKLEQQKFKQRQINKEYISLVEAQKNGFKTNWHNTIIKTPNKLGVTVFRNIDIDTITPFIDWNFFFRAWELNGLYPQLLTDPVIGQQAKKLHHEALDMINHIKQNNWIQANAVVGIFPANSNGDNINIYDTNDYNKQIASVKHLRNQQKKNNGELNLSLADFIAPTYSNIKDYIGAFAVTAGINLQEKINEFELEGNSYSAIMLKIIADRLAEALAEYMHHKVRTDIWGFCKNKNLTISEMLKEEYTGIRPAPGYPACPDHSQKKIIFDLLKAEEHTGIQLTENFAMNPGASVSGWIHAHPNAQYFNIGKISLNQVSDYANRQGISIDETENLFHTILNYK